jgi:putative acetyltransferase
MGYSIARLETGKGQPEAIGLYEKAGYSVIENYGPYIGIENCICMKKEI